MTALRSRLGWLLLAAVSLVLGTATCKKDPPVVQLPNEPAPQRAASSFVHCMESRTSQCVEAADQLVGWDAFHLLAWLGGGSPAAILEALPAELAAHGDPRRAQRRFVDEVERYAASIRGAECEAVSSEPLDPLVDRAATTAGDRLRRLGLWQGDLQQITEALVEEAHLGLGGGHLVRLDCKRDPFRLYVATRERDGQYAVVGMTTLLPRFLDADPPGREVVDARLHSRALGLATASAPIAEGMVHPWMSFPVEDL